MPGHLVKFNPGFRSDDEILAEFLVRQADLDLILGVIRQNTAAPANQHILVIGPRGIGKTTLVLRVAAEIRKRDAELGANWCPLVFSEESYPVSTPGEFWLEAIYHLAAQTGDKAWTKAHEELREEGDETRLRERALARLLDFGQGQGKRLLLIVENLQMLLGDQISADDAWVLRHTLQNEPRLMLLGTATTRFWELNSINHAFYETFRVHDLKPLSNEACRGLWEAVSGVPISETRVRPIQILTGGNPRLLAIIASFGARSSLRELMGDLTRLVDDHTDYFKSHLDDLPAMERKVFVGLCDLWDPATAAQVGRAARTDTNKASAQLQRLVKRGAVIAERDRRAKTYWVAERLYNIYYLMRRRATPSSRVKALVRFMVSFYEATELERIAADIAHEAFALPRVASANHLMYLSELLSSVDEGIRARLAKAVRDSMSSMIGSRLANAFEKAAQFFDLRSQDAAREAEGELRAAVDAMPNIPEAVLMLGGVLVATDDAENREEAASLYEKAKQMEPFMECEYWIMRGLLARDLGQWEDAVDAFVQASRFVQASDLAEGEWPPLLVSETVRILTKLHREDDARRTAAQLLEETGRSLSSLAHAALAASLAQTPGLREAGDSWAREALEKEPRHAIAALGLTVSLMRRTMLESALPYLGIALSNVEQVSHWSGMLVELVSAFAAWGYRDDVRQFVEESPSAPLLEPLACALRLDAGEDVSVAPEIVEVAKDILAKIRERREALKKPTGGEQV